MVGRSPEGAPGPGIGVKLRAGGPLPGGLRTRCRRPEGAVLAEEATESEGRAGGGGDFQFVPRDSNAGEAGHFLPAWSDALTDNKRIRRLKCEKAGQKIGRAHV